jgi:acyl-CoA synthetase (AMP-forming)/AMP-acid ligase II
MGATLPPRDESLPTIPDIADFHAKHNADKPWLIFPSRTSPQEMASLSYKEMNEASHRIAHMLRPGRHGPEGEVVALLINTDTILYAAVLLGVMRAGYVVRIFHSIFVSAVD